MQCLFTDLASKLTQLVLGETCESLDVGLHVDYESLCYKPGGRGLIPDEVIGFFN
jgi:hypothetical protein